MICKCCESSSKVNFHSGKLSINRVLFLFPYSAVASYYLSEKIMHILRLCPMPKKIIEVVVQLLNTSTGHIHFMILIKQVVDEQCLGID